MEQQSFFKRFKVWIIVGVVALIFGGIIVFALVRNQGAASGAAGPAPNTTTLQKMDLEQVITASGTMQSTKSREVTSTLSSEITEIFVRVGDEVNAGDILCQLDTTDIDRDIMNAKDDLSKAQASDAQGLQQAQRRVNEAREQYSIDEKSNNTKVQQASDAIGAARTAAGNAAGNAALEAAATAAANAKVAEQLVNIDTEINDALTNQTIAQAELSLRQAEAIARAVEVEAIRNGALPDSFGYIDLAAAEQASADAKIAEAEALTKLTDATNIYNGLLGKKNELFSVTFAQAKKDLYSSVFTPAYNTAYNSLDVSALQRAYDLAVETRDSVLRMDNIAIKNAEDALKAQRLVNTAKPLRLQLEKLERQREEHTVTAPIAGTITEMAATVGMTPSTAGSTAAAANAAAAAGTGTTGSTTSTALFVINNVHSLEIPAAVAEYDVLNLTLGMPVTVTTDAVDKTSWEGVVDNISPTATDTKGNFTVTVLITSPAGELAAGMSAHMNIIVNSAQDTFAVPFDAVTQNAKGEDVIYVYEPQDASGKKGDKAPAQTEVPTSGGAMSIVNGAAASSVSAVDPSWREIVVTTGLEGDYFIQITSSELQEGMQVVTDPLGKNTAFNPMAGMMGG